MTAPDERPRTTPPVDPSTWSDAVTTPPVDRPDIPGSTTTPPVDPSNMLGAVAALPDQIDAAWQQVGRLTLPDRYRDVDAIVLAGMGGSAISGDLAACLTSDALPVPMLVVRDYQLPAWVGPRTLVIASSFSGGTEETLAAFDDATARGAARLAIASGGALADRARQAGLPVVPLPPAVQPRAVLGASLASVLGVLHAAGLIADPGPALAGATTDMRSLVGPGDGAPGALAAALVGRLPIVYAPEELAPVARRWKTQLNENAKTTAVWETLPELDHNSVVGYAGPPGLDRLGHVVILTYPGIAPRMGQRIDATRTLLEAHGIPHTTVAAPSAERLAAALWLIQFGDLVSVYLAFRYGADPTPVAAIDRLKAQLAGGG